MGGICGNFGHYQTLSICFDIDISILVLVFVLVLTLTLVKMVRLVILVRQVWTDRRTQEKTGKELEWLATTKKEDNRTTVIYFWIAELHSAIPG